MYITGVIIMDWAMEDADGPFVCSVGAFLVKVIVVLNKAGYTAISCGRVGRGGNATVRN